MSHEGLFVCGATALVSYDVTGSDSHEGSLNGSKIEEELPTDLEAWNPPSRRFPLQP